MAALLKIRYINSTKHDYDKFFSVLFYFLNRDKSKRLGYTKIRQELYAEDGFRANMLT